MVKGRGTVKEGNSGQLYGDGRRFDWGGKHTMQHVGNVS